MTRDTATAAASVAPRTYEEALTELERLVASMEAGQLSIDRLLESYQRGVVLLDWCRSRLDTVEQQVKVLEEGQLRPWAET